MGDWRDLGPDQNDIRYLLERQDRQYQRIKDSCTLKVQFVLSVVSLIASFGVIQVLVSRGIDSATWEIPFELANRCTPEAITHRGFSLVGLGWWNSVFGFVFLVLALWMVGEILYANHRVQNMGSLKPRSEADFFLGDTSNWLNENREQLDKAESLLSGVNSRLRYSAVMAFLGGYLFLNVYLDNGFAILIFDYGIVVAGAAFLIYEGWSRVRTDGGFRGLLNVDTARLSVAFLLLLSLAWVVGAYQLYRITSLLQYFFIC